VRFTTSHPVDFSDRLIDVYAELPELVSHIHLPVQSGSDRVLTLMKRGYTRRDYLAIVAKLRRRRPQSSLSSDFIVGFPGETEADFRATMTLIDEVGFDQSFSFLYSPRPGTPAASLRDTTPDQVKRQRLQQLQERIGGMASAIGWAMIGTRQNVLVDGRARKNPAQLSGRTDNNRVVNFDGPAGLRGEFVDIDITEALPNSLRGRWAPQTVPVGVAAVATRL
jgi:tRNA-2-methylthio-N6-dimethylallyladenosine synthase